MITEASEDFLFKPRETKNFEETLPNRASHTEVLETTRLSDGEGNELKLSSHFYHTILLTLELTGCH